MSIYFEYLVKGSPPQFASYGKVLEILGDDLYRVKSKNPTQLATVVDSITPLNKAIAHKNPQTEVVLTNQNLAEILPITLDNHLVLQEEYENYIRKVSVNFNRLYPKINDLSPYFKNLVAEIIDVIGFPYLDITWQIHDNRYDIPLIDLDCVHIDFYRYTNITVPIYLNPNERINFHPTSSNTDIIHTSTYSLTHPSMVNVGIWHSVSLLPRVRRILLQISYLAKFDEIYNKNPNIFRIYS